MAQRSTIAQRRVRLIGEILTWMNKDEFDRGFMNGKEVFGFRTWDDFAHYQRTHVGAFKAADLKFYELLRDRLVDQAELVDKESMAEMRMSGFCFGSTGGLILFNER